MTSHPTNESELQLYRVLQRANLLSYYDTFICQDAKTRSTACTGGDDVQQLCEAGEEEFLEIMALVNMATKPLHVRRLQKALQEWVNNPCKCPLFIRMIKNCTPKLFGIKNLHGNWKACIETGGTKYMSNNKYPLK
ncbi:hypothetical protein LAZ67_16000943 [Cordylochernes scorpioides]|uniref:Nab N-terminal domain-containing protein n=1 Tax=Cordylochernes scorpioides TaxID=51811 RepID=A0ABY6LDM5_9ARAC|nr:hypothetical protein LAZ67_16000943 [Cordylochernes scorpioides]